MPDFEAEPRARYVAFRDGQTIAIQFTGEVEEHPEFKLGDKPAPVYAVFADHKKARWTVTSTQLAETLAKVADHYGVARPELITAVLRVRARGDKQDRVYSVSAPDEAPAQRRLGDAVTS